MLEWVGPNAVRLTDGTYAIPLSNGRVVFTHGPDPRVEENHGGGFDVGDPERPPLCATDYYQHILYGRRSGTTDRFTSVKASIQAAVRRMNAVLNEDGMESGLMNADYKVKCDAAGEIDIGRFTSSGSNFESIMNGAIAAGFDAGNADYTIFFDTDAGNLCGQGIRYADSQPGAGNANNVETGYATIYEPCWFTEAPMHENGHNQGAVYESGPAWSSGRGHCLDENDVMCYEDGGGSTVNICTNRIYYDCGYNTYFDAATESGEWLATHWNIGSPVNRFITFRPMERPPVPAFTVSCAANACSFSDLSTDESAVVGWEWNFGNGSTSTAQHPAQTFATGTYTVSMKAIDDDGMNATSYMTLQVPNNGDPDPSAPNLTNGVATTGRTPPNGQWRYHKVWVPQGRGALSVTVSAPACPAIFVCNPDIDLFVRQGRRPDLNNYACSSETFDDVESCTVTLPNGGYWYVGIHTFLATPSLVIDLTTVDYRVTARF
jgi:PKD repeat protein